MEEKTKFIIILGLAAILVISIFINLQTYSARKAAEREGADLRNENEILNKKIDEATKSRKQIQEEINALKSNLDRISQEKEGLQRQKEEIQRRYEELIRERDTLIEKLKASAAARGEAGSVLGKGDAYWAGVLKSKTDLSFQIENLRQELKTLQADNEQLRRELENQTREKQSLEEQITYNQKMFDNISAQLGTMGSQLAIEKNDKFRLQDELKPVKKENAVLRQQLKSLSIKKIKLENQLRQLQTDKSNLERRVNEIELFLQDRVSRTKDIELKEKLDTGRSVDYTQTSGGQKESVELPPIIVRSQAATPMPEQSRIPTAQEGGTQIYIKGSVVGVNRENNFVVADIGQNTGIKIGDSLRVYREGKAIANIEVIQVRENISACDIKEEILPVEVGDTIR